MRKVRVRHLQCDEIWSFVARSKRIPPEREQNGWGDVWTWTAIDADTKLCSAYTLADRGEYWAFDFMRDAPNASLAVVQVTTDGRTGHI